MGDIGPAVAEVESVIVVVGPALAEVGSVMVDI